MKKMMFSIIAIIIIAMLVFAGCMTIKGDVLPDGTTEDLSVEEYETLVKEAMDVPVTNENGETVTGENGEELTTRIFVESEYKTVTDENGEEVFTKIYKDPSTGKEVTGEVHTTAVNAETYTPPANVTSGGNNEGSTGEAVSDPTSQPANQPAPTVGASEFDYLRNGNFYIKGTMQDASGTVSPLEMAVTSDSIYMLSNFEGANMGMLIKGSVPYMIYEDKKAYLKLDEAIFNYMGMDTSDLFSSGDLDYSQYDLNKADKIATETVKGKQCTVYIFNTEYGTTRFYMDGNKLVRFASFGKSGNVESLNDVEYITNVVPPEKSAPPAGYKSYSGITGLLGFMTLMADLM